MCSCNKEVTAELRRTVGLYRQAKENQSFYSESGVNNQELNGVDKARTLHSNVDCEHANLHISNTKK
jgi:hypothetical protein